MIALVLYAVLITAAFAALLIYDTRKIRGLEDKRDILCSVVKKYEPMRQKEAMTAPAPGSSTPAAPAPAADAPGASNAENAADGKPAKPSGKVSQNKKTAKTPVKRGKARK